MNTINELSSGAARQELSYEEYINLNTNISEQIKERSIYMTLCSLIIFGF